MTDPGAAALLAAFASFADAPGEASTQVEFGGIPVQLERNPEPGIELRLSPTFVVDPDHGWVVRTFSPTESRPPGFPQGLPFIASLRVMVWEPPHCRSVCAIWPDNQDSGDLVRSLVRASRDQGWSGEEDESSTAAPPVFIMLSRPGARRTIAFVSAGSEALVMLNDTVVESP